MLDNPLAAHGPEFAICGGASGEDERDQYYKANDHGHRRFYPEHVGTLPEIIEGPVN
jgi:hypothetical protein